MELDTVALQKPKRSAQAKLHDAAATSTTTEINLIIIPPSPTIGLGTMAPPKPHPSALAKLQAAAGSSTTTEINLTRNSVQRHTPDVRAHVDEPPKTPTPRKGTLGLMRPHTAALWRIWADIRHPEANATESGMQKWRKATTKFWPMSWSPSRLSPQGTTATTSRHESIQT